MPQKLPIVIEYAGPLATKNNRYSRSFSDNANGERVSFKEAFSCACRLAALEGSIKGGCCWVRIHLHHDQHEPDLSNCISPILVAMKGVVIDKSCTVSRLIIEKERSRITSLQIIVGRF